MNRIRIILWMFLAVSLAACRPGLPTASPAPVPSIAPTAQPSEVEVKNIPLAGSAGTTSAELSGLAWYGDWLVLLPQYPHRFPAGPDGALFAVKKSDILDYLAGKSTAPLIPKVIPLTAPGIRDLPGYEGYESIAFQGDSIYLTVEASPGRMLAYLVKGEVIDQLDWIRLDPQNLAKITPKVNVSNMSDEALVILGDTIATFDEVNGANLNPAPAAHLFQLNLNPVGEASLPPLEYRITDATPLDAQNRFWVMNYFYPGDTKLNPAADPLFQKYGKGLTHSQSSPVERLVELEWDGARFWLADRAPIQLKLLPNNTARNWEGLARLDDLGFLAATDSFPSTILGFIAAP